MRLFILIAIAALIYIFFYVGDFFGGGFDHLPKRRLAPDAPVQKALDTPRVVSVNGYNLTLSHGFGVRALVLSSKRYFADREADLSPVDLALGWGAMSNPNPLSLIKISQSNRFYYYRYNQAPPIAQSEIIRSSSNMHMIPADDRVKDILLSVDRGDIVEISGYLVQASDPTDGWRWRSSISRSDTGDGACELVYVVDVRVVAPS